MIRVALLGIVAATLAAGCGGDGGTSVVWEGPPRPLAENGALPSDGFNAYLEATEQPWEASVTAVATAYALPLAGDASSVQTASAPEGASPVTVTIGGVLDDSVAELRLTLTLERNDDRWTATEATWAQRCRPGRGHQDFSPEPCL